MTVSAELKRVLASARDQSQRHYSIETLPCFGELRRLVGEAREAPSLDGLSGVDAFFVLGAAGDRARGVDRGVVAAAACAALADLPADWWGLPGAASSPAAREMIELGAAAEPCLRGLLDDARPLSYDDDGESTTLAKQLGLTRADLAAGMLGAIRRAPYNWRAAPAARATARAAMR
jgi:hypothetical protein